ncbi:MAG: DUF4893 domain-containing protein [Alphaproteobacteria bacterium]|nr:DUF4893 domain-containing protein [Alphaproteobacteria bacterium]
MLRAKTFEAVLVAVLAAAGFAAPAAAGWQEHASTHDADRLARLSEAKSKALEEAESAPARDRAIVHEVFARHAHGVSAASLAGSWHCRTIKLGGMAPDKIYGWFDCRIARDGDTFTFVKLGGGQKTNGRLYPDHSGALVYLGAASTKGEPMHEYSGDGASYGAGSTPDDQIGLLLSTGPSSALLELPWPAEESTMDVIELKR